MVPPPAQPRAILITGASSGIGQALAEGYAAPGVFLALSGRDPARLNSVAATCRERGAQVEPAVVDVADRDAMERWLGAIDDRQPLDLVVANAGIPLADDSDDAVHVLFAVNVGGILNTVLPIIPRFKRRGRGQIAVMSSLAGLRGLPSTPAYSASKNAVRAWGEALRGRLAADGIRVTVICPGFVESRITARNRFPMPFLITADKAARIVIRGLARDKARIAFPWPMAMSAGLIAILPPALGDWLLTRLPFKEQ